MTDNKLRDAAQQALEALDNMTDSQSNPARRNFPTIRDYGKSRRAADALRAALAQHSVYQLPDDLYPDSKCWVDGTYAERVEWLHTMYESSKQTLINVLFGQQDAQAVPQGWQPIETAPLDSTNVLLRWGVDGVSQGHYVPGVSHPWKFIDTNDGITWLINHAVDGPGGPSHWMPMPDVDAAPTPPAQKPLGWLAREAVECLQGAEMTWMPVWNRQCSSDPVPIFLGPRAVKESLTDQTAKTPPAQRVTLTDDEIERLRVDQEFTEWRISEDLFLLVARSVIEAYEIKNGLKS